MRNAKQEFPCQSWESFSVEYYNMENKILYFQFGPVCTNQIRPNYSVGSEQDEAEMQYDWWGYDRMVQLGKIWKDINQLRMLVSQNSGS